MKFNKYHLIGILMIILGIILFLPSDLDKFIRPLTQPLLMGSSKGKDILFFVLLGITLILSTICDNDKIFNKLNSLKISKYLKNKNFYLKIGLVLLILLSIIGLLVEVYLRLNLGLNLNTIFVSMKPSLTTTSILHSHLYKSILGLIIGNILNYIPSGVHTGSSLAQYTPKIIEYIFILIPIIYAILIVSIQKRKFLSRIILALSITIGIIGLMDGGLFATPTIGGIYGILVIIFNEHILNQISDWIISKYNHIESTNSFKSIAKFKKDKKHFIKICIPHIILILIIILRFSIAIFGAYDECYEVNIWDADKNIDLSEYNTLNITETQNKTKVLISNEYNEMELLNSLGRTLEGKCDCYSLSWNFNSYLNKTTPIDSLD